MNRAVAAADGHGAPDNGRVEQSRNAGARSSLLDNSPLRFPHPTHAIHGTLVGVKRQAGISVIDLQQPFRKHPLLRHSWLVRLALLESFQALLKLSVHLVPFLAPGHSWRPLKPDSSA